jgi:S-(hydroxymethyl)glutathione dehydrogenase / alcohol dehydrogenase
MKALVFHKPHDVRVETVPDPRIENARDVILSVKSAGLCGADLRIYNGHLPAKGPFIPGHEFMGVVVEVGPRVKTLKKGDRVAVAFPVSCGECFFCARGLPVQCEKSNPLRHGPDGAKQRGGGVFGCAEEYGSYAGGQAQFVRVPFADVGARKLPDGISDENALLLGSTLPAGWSAAEWCELKGGETVAVFGCGPVGLAAMKSARLQGADRILAVDVAPYRREAARRLAGAEPVDTGAEGAVETIRRMTGGRGADACIDAAGMEAEHGLRESVSNVLHLQVGTIQVLRAAIGAVRRGGVVSVIGAYASPAADFPIDEVFEKGLRLRGGLAPVQARIDKLLELVGAGLITGDDLVTHRLPLGEGPDAYRVCNDKSDECLKMILRPWIEEAREKAPSVESDELDSEPAGGVDVGLVPPTII